MQRDSLTKKMLQPSTHEDIANVSNFNSEHALTLSSRSSPRGDDLCCPAKGRVTEEEEAAPQLLISKDAVSAPTIIEKEISIRRKSVDSQSTQHIIPKQVAGSTARVYHHQVQLEASSSNPVPINEDAVSRVYDYDIATPIRPRARIWAAFGHAGSESSIRNQHSRSPFRVQENVGCPHDQIVSDLLTHNTQGFSETDPLLHQTCNIDRRPRDSPANVSLIKSRLGSICSTADLRASESDTPSSTASGSGDEVLSSTDSHCHTNNKRGGFDKKARTRLIVASILCMVFMTGEMVGGLLAHSLAIISDAAHLLTDFASFMISLMALYLAHRPATKKLSFGWYRIEILGAFVSILMLWVLTGILVYSAVLRIMEDTYEIDATIMLITAATGVAFNVVLGVTLHQHGHSHGGGHGHSHGGHGQSDSSDHSNEHPISHASKPTKESQTLTSSGANNYGSFRDVESADRVDPVSHLSDHESEGHSHHAHTHKPSNINVKAAFIHVLGDLFQSVGVLVAAFIIFYKPEWKIADPICTFMFSLFVLITTITIMRDIVVVLMEGTPRGINFTEVRNTFLDVDGVLDIHNLRVWSLTMDKIALSVHLAVDKQSDPHRVLKLASMAIKQKFNISETTMQIEEYVTEMIDCQDCQGPQL